MHNPIKDFFEPTDGLVDYFEINWKLLGVSTSYVIIFTGRSGSTLLTKLLDKTGLCGNPDEFFAEDRIPSLIRNFKGKKFSEYFQYIVSMQTKGGYFGFEIDAWRYFLLNKLINLDQLFYPESHVPIIWLTRQDLISQAYSFAVAKSSGVWQLFSDGRSVGSVSGREESVIDDKTIWKELLLVLRWEQEIERMMDINGFSPLRLTYEQLISDQSVTIARLMSYIGVSSEKIMQAIDRFSNIDMPTIRMKYSERINTLTSFYSKYSDLINEVINNRHSISILEISKEIGL